MNFTNILLLVSLVICVQNKFVSGISLEENGPRFTEAWNRNLLFSSRIGGSLNCKMVGQPKPTTQWITKDFLPVTNITSLREVDDEGSLHILPFDTDQFRSDIHSTVYRCRGSNQVGSTISPEVHVRGVLDLPFEIENRDVSVLRGNIAVLRCTVPQQVKDFVSVTSWQQDSTVNIYPNFQTGKYSLQRNGDLYVFNVDTSDGYKSFTCRTIHKITNEVRVSPSSRIVIKDSESTESVKLLVPKQSMVKVGIGEDINIPCLASGNPPPSYTWYRGERESFITTSGQSDEILGNYGPDENNPNTISTTNIIPNMKSRHSVHPGPILSISVRTEDSGKVFFCWVNNSISHDMARIQLSVYVPLSVQLNPKSQVVDVGRSATFRCLVTGNPIDGIEWFKDGKRILGLGSRFAFSGNRLELTLIAVEPMDSGMFQCFASNDQMSVQDSAQLRLGSILPELVYRFTEQTLQPGPSVSLKCTGVGNPPPQFQWTLDGFPLPESERYLVGQYVTIHDNVISHVNITNVESLDGGLFTCLAYNSMGSVSHSARLNIYGPPSIRSIPPVKAVAGKPFTIQCPVSGYPIDSITWERGGSILPLNRRQRVYPNGTLIVDQIQQGEDEGIYGCEAKNRQGVTATRDLHVQVIVTPKIMPFQFSSQLLREGMRAAVSCTVIEGDKPFEFSWLFEDRPIAVHSTPSQGPRVTFPDEYSSTLVIDTLASIHSGLYTCSVTNSAGREQYGALLTVNVPPKWTLEPRDINVSAGHSLTVHCQADGYPEPNILWKRAMGTTQPGEYKDLSGSWTGIYENGTIRFDEVRKMDEGQYLCEARNGVGSGLSKVITLRVNAPAQFLDRDQQISVRAGERAILQCRVKGDLPIEIQWFNKHSKVSQHFNPRFMTRQQDLQDGVLTELLISQVSRDDGGIYTCRAGNIYGTDQTSVVLSVQEPPGQPSHLRILEQRSRSVRLSWLEAFNGNSPLLNFILQYKFPSDTWTEAEVEEVVIPPSQTTSRLDRLLPATAYHVRVLASNSMGYSPPSEHVIVFTSEEPPQGPPEQIQIEALSSTQLGIKWIAPLKRFWNGRILGFYLGYRDLGFAFSSEFEDPTTMMVDESNHYGDAGSSENGFQFKSIDVNSLDMTGSTVLQNLSKFSRYAIIVQAFNSQGPGPSSLPVIGSTLPDVPSLPPSAFHCIPRSSQSLEISWEDPPVEGRHGHITSYKIRFHLEEISDPNHVEIKISTLRTIELMGLRRWSNYSVAGLASTIAGDGIYSKPIMCTTDEDVPSPPASIKALASSRRSILVSWLKPERPNGQIDRYTLYMKASETSNKVEKKILQPNELAYAYGGLKENQAYEFWVSASTKMGEGGSTPRVKTLTSSKVPARISSFTQSVQIEWKQTLNLPCESVGIPESTVMWKFSGALIEFGSHFTVDSIGTLKIDSITTSDAGNFSCNVSNPYGSDSITYEVKVQTTPAPPLVNIIESFTDAIHVGWTIGSTGGSPIKGIVIHYKGGGDGDWEEMETEPITNNYILRGLRCGSKYSLYLTVSNKIGSGLPSSQLHVQTKGSPPIPPTRKEDILTGNSSSITIRLENWTNEGCPILRYNLEYKGPLGRSLVSSSYLDSNWIHVPTDLNERKVYTISGLESGSKYIVRISAENDAGKGSVVFDFLTPPPYDGVKWSGNPDNRETDMGETDVSTGSTLAASFLIVFPSILALMAVLGVIIVICYFRRKRLNYGPKTVIGDSPGGMSTFTDNQIPGGIMGGGNRREPRYCPVKTNENSSPSGVVVDGDESLRYKTDNSPDYAADEVCPYATFQLPDKAPGRPLLNKGESRKKFGYHTGETLYNVGNVYSGPYHSLESSAFHYGQAPTMQIRDSEYIRSKSRREFDQPDSDNLVSTDSEVKKILSLHLPITEYDTLGSDSEDGEKFQHPQPPRRSTSPPLPSSLHHLHQQRSHQHHHHQAPPRLRFNHHQHETSLINPNSGGLSLQQHHEMITFRQRQRSDPVITSEQSSISSDSSPLGGSSGGGGCPNPNSTSSSSHHHHLARSKHNKSKSTAQTGTSAKLRVRNSSGYSSHTEETSFSLCDRIQPPTRFSDPRDMLIDGDKEDENDELPSEDEATTSESPASHNLAYCQPSREISAQVSECSLQNSSPGKKKYGGGALFATGKSTQAKRNFQQHHLQRGGNLNECNPTSSDHIHV